MSYCTLNCWKRLMLKCRLLNTQTIQQQRFGFSTLTCSEKRGEAEVIVGGGGIVGLSVAYHLAKRGKFVILLERDGVGLSGATSICAGLVTAPLHWQDPAKQYMAKYSMDLYANLHRTSDFRYNRCGRFFLTNTVEGEVSLRRMFSRSAIYNEGAELFENSVEMRRLFPKWINTDGISIAMFSPNDVALDPVGLCRALANRAREYGVETFEHCCIEEVLADKEHKVIGLRTNKGSFETECFVDATGIWCANFPVSNVPSRRAVIAAHPATYTYLSTKRLSHHDIKSSTPIFTHVDEKTYLYMDEYRTLCAGFAQEEVQSLTRQRILGQWTVPPPDWDKFYRALDHLLKRCNVLGEMDCGELICGAESYTVDKNPVIGETAQVEGYYVATGFSGQGLALAGGAGDLLAGLICGETLPVDLTTVEVTRFIDLHATPQYLIERVPEVAGRLFTNSYEYHQYQSARNLRACPIYHQLKRAGAVFGEVMGYERPLWFAGETAKDTSMSFYSGQFSLIGRPEWFNLVAREYEACRERVGLIDISSFAKFEIEGPDAVQFLQYLCSGNINVPTGTIVYTGMQNLRGGFVSDCAICRLDKDQFFAVASTTQQLRFELWLKKWLKKLGHKVYIRDVTGHYTVLDVVGPSSRALMEKLTKESMSKYDFPTFTIRVAQNVYDRMLESGEEYGILHAGYYALRQLRIEKFYVHWGQDIFPDVTPLECGRAFRIDFSKEFIGKNALLEQQRVGIRKRFVQLLVEDHDLDTDPWPQGGELIYRSGVLVGRTTSAAYGYTLGCQVCIGYIKATHSLTNEFIIEGRYQVDIGGKLFPVRVNLFSPCLPMISSEHTDHYRPTQ